MRKKYKAVRRLLALTLILPLLAACAAQSGGAARNPPDKTQVIIGFPEIPAGFDPLTVSGHGSFVPLLFSSLVSLDSDMNVLPDLAVSWFLSEDALTYTFKLRENARFTNGEPVKASDAAFTINTILSMPTEIDLSSAERAETSGDTVIITLRRPCSAFLLDLAGVGIVPESGYGADFSKNPIGSGPYRLVQYDVDQQFILEANENYYGKIPAIRRAVFVCLPSEDQRLIAVKAGQVDITLTSAVIAAANTVNGYSLLVEQTLDNMGIVMPVIPAGSGKSALGDDMGNDLTCDIAMRRAIAYAIDRQLLCDEALCGYATPAYSENDGMPWSNPESVIVTDVAYAVSLLEDAGWRYADGGKIREKNGVKASIPVYYFAGDSDRQAVAMSTANQVSERIGVELLVTGLSESEIMRLMTSQPIVLAWGSANPVTSYRLFHSSSVGRDDWYDPESFANPTVDYYLDMAMSARTLEEAVPYWQKAQFDGATGTSMRAECPYIFLLNKDHLYYKREGLNTAAQAIHAHGAAWALVTNLQYWYWES